jgi:hypothetical protein
MSNNESEVERHAGIDIVPFVEWSTNPATDDGLIFSTTVTTEELTSAPKTSGS